MKKLIFISMGVICFNFILAQQPITGGHQINISEAPWQVLLKLNGNLGCGGSIIASNVILTAKHCVGGLNSNSVQVVAGITCKNEINNNNMFDVQQIITHPTLDVALLILESNIPVSNKTRSINFRSSLDTQYYNVGNEVSVSGWGWLTPDGYDPSQCLNSVDVNIISNATASIQLGETVSNYEIATAGIGSIRQGACHGDSGGPLVIWSNTLNDYVLIGVVSWGQPSCTGDNTNSPSVFVRVSKLISWINQYLQNTDLYVRDSVGDIGDEPSNASRLWASPDIWIEDMAGNRVNPYGDDDYNVCVRIHNRSDNASLGNERLLLNWAKAGIDLNWSGSWTGEEFFICNGKKVPKGGYVGDINGVVIPSIPAHSNYVIKVKWHVPKREDYIGCSVVEDQLWHFCLLARVYDGHPILHENESSISVRDLVRDNNNVAWRNITILEGKQNRGAVSVGNSFKEPRTFSLSYSLRYNGLDEQLLYNYADVYLNMSSNLFELWQKSDFAGKGFKVVDKNKILLTEPTATIERLVLQPEELYLLEAEVNFFTQEEPENNEFMFDIAEYVDDEKGGKELIGGETYIAIRNSERDSYFKAKAVDDKTVLPAEPVSFRAEPISEDAIYTWFDQKGDTVARGLNLTVTPTSTQHYKLEVVATADGFKDYDSVQATVRNGAIVSLSPNPTDNQLTITYRLAAGITNATIEISDVQNLSVQSYPVTAAATAKTVSLAGLTAGTYVVKLIINGETVDTRQVIKN